MYPKYLNGEFLPLSICIYSLDSFPQINIVQARGCAMEGGQCCNMILLLN